MNNKGHLEKALRLHSEGNKQGAAVLYRDTLKRQPSNAHALHYLGLIASEEGNLELAKKYMERSLVLKPKVAAFHHNIAGFYSRLGDIDSAIHHFTKAIHLKPNYPEAYQGLSECEKMSVDSDIFDCLLEQLKKEDLSSKDKNHLHFATAKFLADSGQYDQAFYHYSLGNQYKKAIFDVGAYQAQLSLTKKIFSERFLKEREGWGLSSRTPIFILGMPRSGTTLIEQILSSHSRVFGAGELNDISQIVRTLEARLKRPYPQFMLSLSHSDARGFGKEYLKRLEKLSKSTEYVINKQPLNFKYIGLILLMFPNAIIIHAQRDPVDTCLSCYFQNFSKGQEYSFDLEKLGHFYNGYQELMTHWQTSFEDKIFSIQYETLVADPEPSIQQLLEFCGLDWEPSCLTHHDTSRPVATASKYQVRQPIYASSVQRWKRYENELQPLLNILNKSRLT